jgi:hypothetical protein
MDKPTVFISDSRHDNARLSVVSGAATIYSLTGSNSSSMTVGVGEAISLPHVTYLQVDEEGALNVFQRDGVDTSIKNSDWIIWEHPDLILCTRKSMPSYDSVTLNGQVCTSGSQFPLHNGDVITIAYQKTNASSVRVELS